MAGTFVERVDDLLRERGITGSRMADDLGMSRSFMTELCKGRAKGVSVETAGRIADYLGVSVDYLLGREGGSKYADPVERELSMYLDDMRRRPEKRMLFSVTKDATKEQIEAIVHMIEELQATK